MATLPAIAIIGRPNVGKSTLFNRLIGRRKAIVHKDSGITRDRIEDIFEWEGKSYKIIDLAGVDDAGGCPIKTEALKQIEIAINKADAILMMVDAGDGVTSGDVAIAETVRKSGKPVILTANKSDKGSAIDNLHDFYSLGIGDPLLISALHSYNINELLERVEEICEGSDVDIPEAEEPIKLAIIGKQNVGKSTLMNAILGEYRAIVSEIPGTTRDSIDAEITVGERRFLLIDTAGMKKSNIGMADVDFYSVRRAQQSLHRADVALLMLDVQDGVAAADAGIAGHIQSARKAYVVLANKWDLTSADMEKHRQAFIAHIQKKLHFLQGAPVVFTSGLHETGLEEIFQWAEAAYTNWHRRLPTAVINSALSRYIEDKPPPAYQGQRVKFFYATQPKVAPPTIVVFVNAPSSVRPSYVRYIQKCLRADYDFRGTPVEVYIKRRRKKSG